MSTAIALTPTSYIVLGLLEAAGPSTPYALKQGVAGSVGNFWSVPHSQLYAEPARLAGAGLVSEEQEAGGRRRRTYAITKEGRAALRAWLGDPAVDLPELRDPALLKLFFGADPTTVAAGVLPLLEEKLAIYEALHAALAAGGDERGAGALLTLEAGMAHAKTSLAFWRRHA